MKKILVSMFAVAALAACTTEQTIVAPQNEAIGFETFVDNSTRANDVTTETIKNFGFGVYVSVTNTAGQSGLILTNEEVSYNGTWGYANTQYWVAGNNYNFTAIAPYQAGEDATWTYAPKDGKMAQHGVISFNNRDAAANQDLVFATAAREVTVAPTTQPDAVEFAFNHMLSRVMFTFANGFANNSNIKLEVYDVTITDAISSADLAIDNGVPAAAWSNISGTFARNFGMVGGDTLAQLVDEGVEDGTVSASTEHFYLIPAPAIENKTYNVTFKVDLYQAGVKLDTYERSATIPATTEMKSGMSYNIKTTLTDKNTSDDGQLYPIVFEVESIVDWDKDHDGKENTEAGDTDGDKQVDTNLPLN